MSANEHDTVARTGHRAHPGPREYIRIAVILGILTLLEITTYYVDIDHSILIPTLFVLAIVKFALVVLWFMHLRFDDKRYARFFMMGLAGSATLYLVVLMLFGVFSK